MLLKLMSDLRLSMEEQATQFWDEIRRNQAAVPPVDPHDIEACEALLESYYMQVLPHMMIAS